jgi:peptide/nickel transport system substrate-binding protein
MRHGSSAPVQVLVTLCAVAVVGVALSAAQDAPVRDVPRTRTLVSQGWDLHNQVPDPTNLSPYAGVLASQRNVLHYTINELLFYTDHNSGRVTPWQGESWQYNRAYTELTVKIRKGVRWSDGKPFTARDVAFTLNMLKQNAPAMPLSPAIAAWVREVRVVDDLTVHIVLTKPGPRWAKEFLAQGQATRFVVVPEHVWKGQEAKTFRFYDPARGWPVGTGPYRLVKTGADSMVFDRRDTWWAVETGVARSRPEVERVVYKPAALEALPQLYINNDLDIGWPLRVGTFQAARARNPRLISWSQQGPVWGAPDGCVFRLIVNNQKPPFDDVEVRRALNAAINRDQIVDLAFERSVPKAVAPLSSYAGIQQYATAMKEVFAKAGVDAHSPQKTAEILTRKGFKKGADGRWVRPDGARWPITIQMEPGNPIGPVLTQQLQEAGFDAVFQVLQSAAFVAALTAGDFETALWVHCGSLDDPWQTLEHYHGKYAAAPGQKVTHVRTLTRYANPQLDALLDRMEAMEPLPGNPRYLALARDAMEIYLRDLPDITLAEEFHVITLNSTYWTGWPSADNPYVAPYVPWEGYALIIHRLRPTR